MTANLGNKMGPQTSKNPKGVSRVELMQEDSNTVNADLLSFESKIKGRYKLFKYPNIELKRCFDSKSFRKSNEQVTRMATTRAGTMRSHIRTSVPKKHRRQNEKASSTCKLSVEDSSEY